MRILGVFFLVVVAFLLWADSVKREARICRYCSHSFSDPVPAPPQETADKNEYFFQVAGGIQQGPVNSERIMSMIQSGRLEPEDQVLTPMQGWHKVSKIKTS